MKKLFILTAFTGFAFVSCDSGSNTTTQTETLQDTTTVVEEREVEIQRSVDVDTSDEEVVDTLNRY